MQASNILDVQRRLAHLEHRGYALAPLMAEIANLLQTSVEDAFDSQTSPMDGAKWEPLKDSTLAKKQGKPLYESGRMQDSLNAFSTPTQAGIGIPATAKGYAYPAVHQFGTEDGSIPARPFLPMDASGNITDALRDDILGLAIEHFQL